MRKSNFGEDFKRDAVLRITQRGYPVAEVSPRLGVRQHSLYEWKKKIAAANAKDDDEAEGIRRLRKEPAHQDGFDYIEMVYKPKRKHVKEQDAVAR